MRVYSTSACVFFAQEVPVQVALQRKKSLPDVQVPPNAPASITREEVSVLSSARREEMRRVEEENERLRANPLLYLVSPHMKVRVRTNNATSVTTIVRETTIFSSYSPTTHSTAKNRV